MSSLIGRGAHLWGEKVQKTYWLDLQLDLRKIDDLSYQVN